MEQQAQWAQASSNMESGAATVHHTSTLWVGSLHTLFGVRLFYLY